MTKTLWIANTKGGVGKTTLAIFLANAYLASGATTRLLDCDSRRKLAAFMDSPDNPVLGLDIGASADEVRQNPSLAISYWDRLAEEILEGGDVSVVDLGANVDRMVWQWAERSRVSELFKDEQVDMDIFIPVSAEPLAVEGGLQLIEESRKVFPEARRILVLNQVAGSFDSYADTEQMKRLSELKKTDGLKIVVMPRCLSEGWVDFERLRLNFAKVLEMTPQEVEAQSGLSRLGARRAIGDLGAWVEKLYENFGALVPSPQAAAAPAPKNQVSDSGKSKADNSKAQTGPQE